MGGESIGALVPTVKTEPSRDSTVAATPPPTSPPPPLHSTPPALTYLEEATAAKAPAEAEDEALKMSSSDAGMEDLDKDILCPICMQIIKDAFLTSCGHSFCYMCIATHLRNKSDCPCCGHFLTANNIFPNILLDKLLKKTSARQMRKTTSPFGYICHALQQGCDVDIKELDGLLSILVEKKRKMEQQEAETNMQIILDFLHCLRKRKLEELNEIQADLQSIEEDINAVERRRIELYRVNVKNSGRLRTQVDDTIATKAYASLANEHESGSGPMSTTLRLPGMRGSSSSSHMKHDVKVQGSSQERKYVNSGLDLSFPTPTGVAVARKRRVHSQFNELQECYLQKQRNWRRQLHKLEETDTRDKYREGYSPALDDFQSVLTTFIRYSRLRVIAELRHGDVFHSANIVSSIEFDRDDEFFATAGVSRCIKVFEFASVVNELADVHFPVVEMSTRSKLSCLSWNKYTKSHIASSDYEGIVTVWDVNTRQSVIEYEEHEKRAWSVDFSRAEPSMLVSGSDDFKEK